MNLEMISFLIYLSFLSESPRWLLTKNREKDAYKILFNKKYDMEYPLKENTKAKEAEPNVTYIHFFFRFRLA